MMRKQIIVLMGIVVVFLGILLAMPSAPGMKPSRLAKDLPETIGNWEGKPQEPGAAERKILAADTEFERMNYVDLDDRKTPIEVSIVFSGKNITQSIHRPEICLRSQGWEFIEENYISLEGVLPGGASLPVKELICRKQRMREEGDAWVPATNPKGEPFYDWRSSYYTFFGHEKIVSGHYERTIEDMKDRLFKGYDQRWAYATFSSTITSKYVEQGINIGNWPSADEKETKALLCEFLRELFPLVVSDPGEGEDATLSNPGSGS